MMRKILLAVGIVLVVLVSTAYLIHRLAEFVRKADSAQAEKLVPAIVKGDGQFEKRVFYSSYGLGSISQILVGWPADKEGAAVAVVGNKEAHFLDLNGQLKKQIRFTSDLNCPIEVARLDASGDYAYLTRDEGWFFSATLLDKEGQVRWSFPGGKLKGVDDSVSGNVYGDRKLWVVIGFNGGGGLALINGEGKEVWRKKEANVWHVEMLDTNGDGRDEILHSNARGQLLVRNANGDVIAQYLPGFDVSDFTVTRWGEEPKPTHILVPTKRGEGTLNSVFLVLEANGKKVVQLEAPLGDLLNATKATPLRYGKGAEYFAVLQNRATWERSMLVLYDKGGQIAYQEILGESCLGLVTVPQKNTEALLVGCDGKIWEYSPVLQTKRSLTSATR